MGEEIGYVVEQEYRTSFGRIDLVWRNPNTKEIEVALEIGFGPNVLADVYKILESSPKIGVLVTKSDLKKFEMFTDSSLLRKVNIPLVIYNPMRNEHRVIGISSIKT